MSAYIRNRVRFKKLATTWSVAFWDSLSEPTPELVDKITAIANNPDIKDDAFVEGVSKTTESSAKLFIFKRFAATRTSLSFKALACLSEIVTNPGQVSMLVAAIIHLHRAIDLGNERGITWDWLSKTVFNNKYHSKEAYSLMWEKQKFMADYTMDSNNLVDYTWAFELLTDEEMMWLERNPEVPETA